MTSLRLENIRRQQREIETRSVAFLSGHRYLEGIDSWLQILLDCHALALDRRLWRRSEPREYLEAYSTVVSTAFSNAESARLMLLKGFYGNVMNNIRALVVANDVVVDLTVTEQSPAKWLRLRDFQPDDRNAEAKSLREYFKDSSVRKRVAKSGETSLSEGLYGIASESVHFSPWGTHLFCAEDLSSPGEFYIRYTPQYHPFRAMFFAFLLENTLPHLSGYFLMACDRMFPGNHRFAGLGSRYQVLLEAFERESPKRRAVLQKYREAENRVRAGEGFGVVFSDP
jgi:hypothetical protein